MSTPGSTRVSLELHEQPHAEEQQHAPWAGMQLRPVAHLVHEQQQQQLRRQQQQREEGVQADGAPWYRCYQLERRHTFANAMELSVAADGAVAAVDGAAAAFSSPSTAAAAGRPLSAAVCSTSSRSPLRRCSSHADGSGAQQDPAQYAADSPSGLCQASACVAAGGNLTPHRLSCSSSATGSQLESEGSGGADAAAAVLLTPPAAGLAIKPQDLAAQGWV